MTTYNCDLCNFETRIKTHLNTHHNTKKHKINKEKADHKFQKSSTKEHKTAQSIAQKSTKQHNTYKNHRCDYCFIILKTKANLTRHLKHYCKSYSPSNNVDEMEKKIKNIEELLEDQQKLHEKEKKLLYKQIEKLLDKVGNTTNIQHNNIESNIQNNIILNNYGKEDLSHITDTFKEQLIKIPYSMIPKMIEAVHFNDKKPENKNISLTNKKDNLIKIFKNNKWIYQGKEETINSLVDGKYCILDSYYEDNFENSDNDIIRTGNEITKTNYGKFRHYFEKSEKDLVEKLKKECEIVLLNNR
jgi:hypothetical protein